MKKIAFAILLGVFANFAIANECPNPGQVLNRDFERLTGEQVQLDFKREGTAEISSTATLTGDFNTKIHKVFKETFCKPTKQTYKEQVCADVTLDQALGRGNESFRSLYDLRINLIKRAEDFARFVAYMMDQPQSERLGIAREIVSFLGKYAAMEGIPTSWMSFSAAITEGVAQGIITQAVADEILTAQGDKNKFALGFTPLQGVEFTEGKGNGNLPRFFDLGTPTQVRADFIELTLTGVTPEAAQSMSIAFIQFAASSGVPENWTQFVVMMKAIQQDGTITQAELDQIVNTYEDINRASLGFERTAKICKIEEHVRDVNVISERRVSDFFENVKKSVKVQITEGALLQGEEETYALRYDGLSDVAFVSSRGYNTYSVATYNEKNNLITMVVKGKRDEVVPSNLISTQIVRDGKFINLKLQNRGFNAKVGGKVIVWVDYYESIPFWPDYKLGTKSYELTDGSVTEILSKIQVRKASRKARVDISVQIVGSPYYSDKISRKTEFKE